RRAVDQEPRGEHRGERRGVLHVGAGVLRARPRRGAEDRSLDVAGAIAGAPEVHVKGGEALRPRARQVARTTRMVAYTGANLVGWLARSRLGPRGGDPVLRDRWVSRWSQG